MNITLAIDPPEDIIQTVHGPIDPSRCRTAPSGLYQYPPFYQIHLKKRIIVDVDLWERDMEAFTFHYVSESDELDEDEIEEMFSQYFDYSPSCFEPLIFNPEIAWRCGLIPFAYDEIGFLSLNGGGMDLMAHLDAYQVLTTKKIDKGSKYFRDRQYFEYVVGKKLLEEIDGILEAEQFGKSVSRFI